MLEMKFPNDMRLLQTHQLQFILEELGMECLKTHPFISEDDLDVPKP